MDIILVGFLHHFAVSIDELTKPRPTASQNTRRREQRQPQLSPNQQWIQHLE